MSDKEEAIDILTLRLCKTGFPLDDLKREITIALEQYNVIRKEQEIIPYTGGKTQYMIQRYILSKGISGLTQRSLEQYAKELTRIFDGLSKEYDQITSEDVQMMIGRAIARGCSKNYANHQRVVLNGFFSWLNREEIYLKNPVAKVDKVKYKTKPQYAFTYIEVEKIRNSCDTSREKAIVELLLSTGCRATELCMMKIDDVKTDDVQIIGKGEKPRLVYINARARISIDQYLADRNDTNPWLFPASIMKNGNGNIALLRPARSAGEMWFTNPEYVSKIDHIEKDYVNNAVKKIAKRAGVVGAHTHRFRRTCATNALKHGMPIELVSRMLGHSNIQTTMIYLDISEKELQIAHEKYVV